MNIEGLFSLKGKRGIITGAAGGIGSCLVGAFAELGAHVVVVDRKNSVSAAESISNRTGRKLIGIDCDVTQPDCVRAMYDEAEAALGGIDFSICNAGIFGGKPVMEIDEEELVDVLNVNLCGVFYTAQEAARRMIQAGNGGSIVMTASMSGHIVNRPQTITSYCASKAGVIQLAKNMAVELARHKIRVNSISPGYIITPSMEGADVLPTWLTMMPEGARLGKPEDLISAYAYFVSDGSSFTTGTDLVVDGGYTAL